MLRLFFHRKILGNELCQRVRQLCNENIDCTRRKCNSELHPARSYATSCSDKKSNGSCINKPMAWPSGNPAKFKFHEETEAILNEQINAELKAFYYYLSMVRLKYKQLPSNRDQVATQGHFLVDFDIVLLVLSILKKDGVNAAYFGRVDVALPGCESFFMQMHHEEHEHALRFVNYVKMRGGRVNLLAVQHPADQDWKCPLHAFKTALDLEMEVSEKLVAVNTVAEKHNDLNASDFIVTGFMEDQMKSINEMAKFHAVLSGIGDHALARFIFDKDLLENHVQSKFNVLRVTSRQNAIDK